MDAKDYGRGSLEIVCLPSRTCSLAADSAAHAQLRHLPGAPFAPTGLMKPEIPLPDFPVMLKVLVAHLPKSRGLSVGRVGNGGGPRGEEARDPAPGPLRRAGAFRCGPEV